MGKSKEIRKCFAQLEQRQEKESAMMSLKCNMKIFELFSKGLEVTKMTEKRE